jgi:hypothetical protein
MLGLRGKVDVRIDIAIEDGLPYKTRGFIKLWFVLVAKIGYQAAGNM